MAQTTAKPTVRKAGGRVILGVNPPSAKNGTEVFSLKKKASNS